MARRRGCTLTEGAAGCILNRLGWRSPYYLERIAADACGRVNPDRTVDTDSANLAMERLLELDKRLYWASWREHLDRNFTDPDRARLYLVLETVAKTDDGANVSLLPGVLNQRGKPIAELTLRDLANTLLADGYLVLSSDGRYQFMMHLLREWWLRYVVLCNRLAPLVAK